MTQFSYKQITRSLSLSFVSNRDSIMLLIFISLPLVQCFLPTPQLDNIKEHPITSDPGEPLFVTPYLDTAERREKARGLAEVKPLAGDVKSYAGYFTVNQKYKSNLFFWFFPSEYKPSDPVVLWLHGGPGQSSLMGLFHENGPFVVIKDKAVLRNGTRWTLNCSMLFIDNPVGAGYSFTEDSDGYSRTVQDAADNLYEALRQFFILFPTYESNKFVLSGQSYGGKYIPVLAKVIRQKNQEKGRNVTINLSGLFIGCGYINPPKQIQYADFLYENGIVDKDNRNAIAAREKWARDASEKNRYYVTSYHLAIIAAKIVLAGYRPPYDVEQPSIDFGDYDNTVEFIQKGQTRAAIHVGSQKFQGNARVVWYFRADVYKSIISELSAMLDHYKVLLYAGQFDMIIPPSQIDQVIASLSWDKVKDFHQAQRKTWYVNGKLAGYRKSYGNLEQAFVRRANHAIVGSQPVNLFDLMKKFCANLDVASEKLSDKNDLE